MCESGRDGGGVFSGSSLADELANSSRNAEHQKAVDGGVLGWCEQCITGCEEEWRGKEEEEVAAAARGSQHTERAQPANQRRSHFLAIPQASPGDSSLLDFTSLCPILIERLTTLHAGRAINANEHHGKPHARCVKRQTSPHAIPRCTHDPCRVTGHIIYAGPTALLGSITELDTSPPRPHPPPPVLGLGRFLYGTRLVAIPWLERYLPRLPSRYRLMPALDL